MQLYKYEKLKYTPLYKYLEQFDSEEEALNNDIKYVDINGKSTMCTIKVIGGIIDFRVFTDKPNSGLCVVDVKNPIAELFNEILVYEKDESMTPSEIYYQDVFGNNVCEYSTITNKEDTFYDLYCNAHLPNEIFMENAPLVECSVNTICDYPNRLGYIVLGYQKVSDSKLHNIVEFLKNNNSLIFLHCKFPIDLPLEYIISAATTINNTGETNPLYAFGKIIKRNSTKNAQHKLSL